MCVFYFARKLIPGQLSNNTSITVIDGLIFMIANVQHVSTLIAMSLIIMNLYPLCNFVDMDIASLLIMKILRFVNMAVCTNFYGVYINLVIMVYVLHTSQLVQCGEVLLQWSLVQSRKFFQARYIVSVTYQMNTSYETYSKMHIISNLMEDTYFYLRLLVLSLGAFILVICNYVQR